MVVIELILCAIPYKERYISAKGCLSGVVYVCIITMKEIIGTLFLFPLWTIMRMKETIIVIFDSIERVGIISICIRRIFFIGIGIGDIGGFVRGGLNN